MDDPRILIIIPAHNEAGSLAGVIAETRTSIESAAIGTADIVVVDDGSADDTAEIALECGVELLKLPFNLGIGSTMQTGFRFAQQEGYEIAVQVDGDGQHDASFLPQLIGPLMRGECDLVVGSRYLNQGSYRGTAGRRAGTAFFSRILSLMLRQKLTDATSGFRAINRKLIEHFAQDYPRDYPEVEVLLLAHRAHCRVKEIPVVMHKRAGGSSSINTFRSVYYMVKVLLALMVVATRERTPRAE